MDLETDRKAERVVWPLESPMPFIIAWKLPPILLPCRLSPEKEKNGAKARGRASHFGLLRMVEYNRPRTFGPNTNTSKING
jgi:hypothetical protein